MHKALFWKKGPPLRCSLCARNCIIPEGSRGFCGVRENRKGALVSLVYAKPCSIAVDPIEKKPFYHFAPGTETLSIATVGCNFRCSFCQNFEISQTNNITTETVSPKELIAMNKTPGFSWTYTEPTVFYEYFYETARLSKKFYHTWVSNGYTNTEPIKKASKFLNAVNVDYKGNWKTYHDLCQADIEPVQNALVAYKRYGVHLEITNLVIPGYNDKDEQIKEMVQWILDNVGQVPLHFSRFFPMHKLNAPVTPEKTLERAAAVAEKMGMDYVYVGNIRHEKENTFCHNCKHLLIKRNGYHVEKFDIVKKGKDYNCPNCATKIPLAGMEFVK
jgi:pyruvate formate lyase activating enzyme